MSSQVVIQETRKLRLLCLHGFRTSGRILKAQLQKWPQSVLDKLDLVFPDAPFTSTGKSQVEGFFDPPYYEWFQSSNKVRILIHCMCMYEQTVLCVIWVRY